MRLIFHISISRINAWSAYPDVAESEGMSDYPLPLNLHQLLIQIGERRAIMLYGVIAIGYVPLGAIPHGTMLMRFDRLEVTVWVVPSLLENAIAVSFVGLLFGPMYPIMMNHSTSILPKWLLTGAVGYIAGIGQAGSAVLPLVTGLLASKFGIGSLQPLCVSFPEPLRYDSPVPYEHPAVLYL